MQQASVKRKSGGSLGLVFIDLTSAGGHGGYAERCGGATLSIYAWLLGVLGREVYGSFGSCMEFISCGWVL